MDKEIKNEMTPLDDVFYKPSQIVEGYFIDKYTGELCTLTTFKMKSLNIIIKFVHNSIFNNENMEIDKYGQTVFVMDYDRFFNDIDASSCSYDNVYDIREQICDLQNLYIKTNSKIQFTRFSLIPEISVTNEHIKMVISPRLIYSIKNNYCSMTDDDSSTDISYIRLNSEYHHQTKDDIVLKMYDLLVSRSSFNASKIIKYDIEQLINMFGRSSYNTNSRFIDRIIKPIVKGLYDDYGLILYYVCETGRYNRIKSVSFICYIDKSYNGKHKDYDRRNVSKDKNGSFMWNFEPKNKLDILNFKKIKFEKYKLLIEKDLTNVKIKEFDDKIKEEKLQISIKNAIKMDL